MSNEVKNVIEKVVKETVKETTEAMKAVKYVRDPEGFMVPVWMERKSLMADVK